MSSNLKDGRKSKGKIASKVCFVTDLPRGELGSTIPNVGGIVTFQSVWKKVKIVLMLPLPMFQPVFFSDEEHLGSAKVALNNHKGNTGECFAKTVSGIDMEVIDNGSQASKASHSSCEEFDDKYALEMHVSSKKSDKIQFAKSPINNLKCIRQNRALFSFIPIL